MSIGRLVSGLINPATDSAGGSYANAMRTKNNLLLVGTVSVTFDSVTGVLPAGARVTKIAVTTPGGFAPAFSAGDGGAGGADLRLNGSIVASGSGGGGTSAEGNLSETPLNLTWNGSLSNWVTRSTLNGVTVVIQGAGTGAYIPTSYSFDGDSTKSWRIYWEAYLQGGAQSIL